MAAHHAPLAVTPVLDGLRAWAHAAPEATLYVWLRHGKEAARLTCGQLYQRSSAVARALTGWGLKSGDRALLVFSPARGLDFVEALFGCLRAGVIPVPLCPPAGGDAMRTLLRVADTCGARVALTDRTYVWAAAALRVRCAVSGDVAWTLAWRSLPRVNATDSEPFMREPAHEPRDVAFIQFSSGSTGAPKGVIVTHGCLAHNCALIRRDMRIDATCCEVSWLPLYHDMGLVGGVLAAVTVPPPAESHRALLRRAPCVLMSPLDFLSDPLVWVRALSDYRATHTQAPDFAYALVASRAASAVARGNTQKDAWDLSSLRCALSGADTARPATADAFRRVFCEHARFPPEALTAGYGLAESTVFVSQGGTTVLNCDRAALEDATSPKAVPSRSADANRTVLISSCGIPPPEVDLIIVDATSGTVCTDDGAVGEIWLRSESVAAGYWADPEATRAAFYAMPKSESLFDDQRGRGYLRTGDLGFKHRGELYLTGRIKDVLVLRGRKHAPQDVEQTAIAACPALRPGSCAAFTADLAGEASAVLVAELRATKMPLQALTISEKVLHAVTALHGIALADIVLVAPRTLPKTTSGKLRRSECRQRYLDGQLGSVFWQLQAQRTGVDALYAATQALEGAAPAVRRRQLAVAIRKHVGVTLMSSDMFASGLDSARAAALHTALERALLVALPPATVFECRTPDALAAAVVQLRWPDAPQSDWLGEPEGAVLPKRCITPAGVGLTTACAAIVLLHVARMRTALPVSWWSKEAAHYVAHGPAYARGWLHGRHIDLAHWRLLEWTRTVLPVHLVLNTAVAYATVHLRPQALSPRSVTAAWGLAHAVLLHGIWALPPLLLAMACFVFTRVMLAFAASRTLASRRDTCIRILRRSAWVCVLGALLYFNLSEPGNLLWPLAHEKANRLERAFLRLTNVVSVTRADTQPYVGLLGATSFTSNRSFRYMALRLLSYVIDISSDGELSGVLHDFELFLAYVLYAPLYLSGPVMAFSQFKSSAAACATTFASAPPGPTMDAAVAFRVILCATCGGVFIEVALHTFYWPSAVLHPSLAGASSTFLRLRWHDYVLYGFLHLTATWAASAVVFAVPRGVALLQGVAPVNDTPAFWVGACASARSFWTQFHVSLFQFFMRYVYAPLGGGTAAVIAVTALSTFLHGFHSHWLAWGFGNACVLCLERALKARASWYATPSVFVRAANQTVVVMMMGSLACGDDWPQGMRVRVAAVCFMLSTLHNVDKRR